jgi:hypothetical protein
MLGTTEWLQNLWPLEWYSAPQLVRLFYIYIYIYIYIYGEREREKHVSADISRLLFSWGEINTRILYHDARTPGRLCRGGSSNVKLETPSLFTEGAPHQPNPYNYRILIMITRWKADTKTDWHTDRRQRCNFDFNSLPDISAVKEQRKVQVVSFERVARR